MTPPPRCAKTLLPSDTSGQPLKMTSVTRTDEIWRAAIADSGLEPSTLHRFGAVRAVIPGTGAQWWAPGESVYEPPINLELSAEDAAAADATPIVEKHRV